MDYRGKYYTGKIWIRGKYYTEDYRSTTQAKYGL